MRKETSENYDEGVAESSHICHSERSEESLKVTQNRDSSLRASHSAQNDNFGVRLAESRLDSANLSRDKVRS